MTGYLHRLVRRAVGTGADTVRPRPRSLFEPSGDDRADAALRPDLRRAADAGTTAPPAGGAGPLLGAAEAYPDDSASSRAGRAVRAAEGRAVVRPGRGGRVPGATSPDRAVPAAVSGRAAPGATGDATEARSGAASAGGAAAARGGDRGDRTHAVTDPGDGGPHVTDGARQLGAPSDRPAELRPHARAAVRTDPAEATTRTPGPGTPRVGPTDEAQTVGRSGAGTPGEDPARPGGARLRPAGSTAGSVGARGAAPARDGSPDHREAGANGAAGPAATSSGRRQAASPDDRDSDRDSAAAWRRTDTRTPAGAPAWGPTGGDAAEPTVTVTIGRVEVVVPPDPQGREPRVRRTELPPLADYLRERGVR